MGELEEFLARFAGFPITIEYKHYIVQRISHYRTILIWTVARHCVNRGGTAKQGLSGNEIPAYARVMLD